MIIFGVFNNEKNIDYGSSWIRKNIFCGKIKKIS
jgi:hypothetical protein